MTQTIKLLLSKALTGIQTYVEPRYFCSLANTELVLHHVFEHDSRATDIAAVLTQKHRVIRAYTSKIRLRKDPGSGALPLSSLSRNPGSRPPVGSRDQNRAQAEHSNSAPEQAWPISESSANRESWNDRAMHHCGRDSLDYDPKWASSIVLRDLMYKDGGGVCIVEGTAPEGRVVRGADSKGFVGDRFVLC